MQNGKGGSMRDLKPITMYQCHHCKKLFKTPDRHVCRRDPDYTNCYTCEHWGHQFYMDYSEYNGPSCSHEEACKKHETSWVEEAHHIMRESGWYLECPEYKKQA